MNVVRVFAGLALLVVGGGLMLLAGHPRLTTRRSWAVVGAGILLWTVGSLLIVWGAPERNYVVT